MAQPTGAAEYTDCISAEEKDTPNACPRNETKQSNSEISEMLKHWVFQSISLLLGEEVPDRVLSMSQIELFST